jgi:hypothetical protein
MTDRAARRGRSGRRRTAKPIPRGAITVGEPYTDDAILLRDALDVLTRHRQRRRSDPLAASYLTVAQRDVVVAFWRTVRHKLIQASHRARYPTWVSVDGLRVRVTVTGLGRIRVLTAGTGREIIASDVGVVW